MLNANLNERIVDTGKRFFSSIGDEAPSVFNKGFWTGKVMEWAMRHEDFKVQLFRFVDVLPYINTPDSLSRHIEEYFGGDGGDIPPVLKWGADKTGLFGRAASVVMAKAIRSNIEKMARQFIIGQNAKEALKSIKKLRADGFAFTLDLLGEATISEEEADAYMRGYLEVLDAMGCEQSKWKPLGAKDELDWGYSPRINVSVKPSALYSQAKPVDVRGSVEGVLSRLAVIYEKVRSLGGALCVDMESLKYKEITLELFKRLRTLPEASVFVKF